MNKFYLQYFEQANRWLVVGSFTGKVFKSFDNAVEACHYMQEMNGN